MLVLPLSWLLGCPAIGPVDLQARFDADLDGHDDAAAWGGDDCDDGDASVHPGADEVWYDGIDQDCDGNDVDADGDGVPGPDEDCDDGDPTVHPGADEGCDGDDSDCDGVAGELEVDGDGDGWMACDDCDDADETVNPGAIERCDDGVADEDCDGFVDDADDVVEDLGTWYLDSDGDGVGTTSAARTTCDPPAGYVDAAGDCDDLDAAAWPGAQEACDGVDGDCDGEVPADEVDADGDGWLACAECDDADAAVSPDGAERCNDADDDCDGLVDADDDSADPYEVEWYRDADGDGHGAVGGLVRSCDPGDGYVRAPDDCDDASATSYPGSVEVCGGADEDCDGRIDDDDPDVSDPVTWWLDADADGWGDATAAIACVAPTGYVAGAGDCDDADPDVSPDADERCDGAIDDDCDGDVDESDAVDPSTWYADVDADSFGDPASPALACDAPAGFVADDTDCDDASPAVNPAAAETCDTPDDDDCDGSDDAVDAVACTRWYEDEDGDGYGGASGDCTCVAPAGFPVSSGGDCDDTVAVIHPGRTETCDTAWDDDCDGAEDAVDAEACVDWHVDADGDGQGGGTPQCTCEPIGPYTSDDGTDCDDDDPLVYDGAVERGFDGADTDCDGDTDDVLLSASWGVAYGPRAGDVGCDVVGALGDVDGDGLGDFAGGSGGYDGVAVNGGTVWIVTGGATSTAFASARARLYGDASEYAGDAVAGVGDLDGDGVLDIVVGGSVANAVWLVPASVSGSVMLSTQVEVSGAAAGDYTGDRVAGAGDPDGDGLDELLVSAPGSDAGGSNAGVVYLLGGTSASASVGAVAEATIVGDRASAWIGSALASGDLDGDGLPDVVVGASDDDTVGTDAGAVWVFLAPLSGTVSVGAADAKLTGEVASDDAGRSVAVGDLHGDGSSDLVVGASGTDGGDGSVYVVDGATTGTLSLAEADARVDGSSSNGWLGYAVTVPGDVDADGVDDLVVSAPNLRPSGARYDTGGVFVLYGPPAAGVTSTNSADELWYGSSGYLAGAALAAPGDVDGDLLPDVVTGNPLDTAYPFWTYVTPTLRVIATGATP